MSENSSPSMGNSKLTTMFLIVLGVHVVIVIGLCAYSFLKGDSAPAKKREVTKNEQKIEVSEPAVTEALASSEVDEGYNVEPVAPAMIRQDMDEQKAIESQPVEVVSKQVAYTPEYSSSMPRYNDSVWKGVKSMPKEKEEVRQPVEFDLTVKKNESVQRQPQLVAAESVVGQKVAESSERLSGPMTSYTVKKGNTLSGIAKKYGITVRDIKRANGLSKDMIKIGQRLSIPAGGSSPAPRVSTAKVENSVKRSAGVESESSGYSTYVVRAGDTLWRISRNHGTKPDVLARLNGLADPTKIKVGMKLKIPLQKSATVKAKQEDPEVVPFRTKSMSSEMAMLREAGE